MNLTDIVASIMATPAHHRIVAIDGPGGAGKSTFALELSRAAAGAPVIHTDDFATADETTSWWPRLLSQVVEPIVVGEAARYQRYDWATEAMAEWVTVEPAPVIIIEGVSAGRSEWAEHLSFLIWIETDRQVRLRRGLERDGVEATEDWQRWMAQEDAHYLRDPTRGRADIVIDGTQPR